MGLNGAVDGVFDVILFIWAVLSDEQMSNGWSHSLLNDEQMSNKVRVEHQPVMLNGFGDLKFFDGYVQFKRTVKDVGK